MKYYFMLLNMELCLWYAGEFFLSIFSEDDCFTQGGCGRKEEGMRWKQMDFKEVGVTGERVMNGLKACSSWSLYVGRYDMTYMLVTSSDNEAEGEKGNECLSVNGFKENINIVKINIQLKKKVMLHQFVAPSGRKKPLTWFFVNVLWEW